VTPLRWREAQITDKAALKAFTCTTHETKLHIPGRRKPKMEHPRPWELMLQKSIHTLNPRCGDQEALLLGEDDDGLAAVVNILFLSLDEAKIMGVAVASRRRCEDGSCANEAVDEAINWAASRADARQLTNLLIYGSTDRRNRAARHLMERSGFAQYNDDEDMIDWYVRIDLQAAD
jgi:hypothetical protein